MKVPWQLRQEFSQSQNVLAGLSFTQCQGVLLPDVFNGIEKEGGMMLAHSGYTRTPDSHTQLGREDINSHLCIRNQQIKTRRGPAQRGNSRK